jgi:hypothetical protein
VHVHGFFDLNSNRRHVKWPTPSKGDNSGGPTDVSLQWNQLLVKEVLPRAYLTMVQHIIGRHSQGALPQ